MIVHPAFAQRGAEAPSGEGAPARWAHLPSLALQTIASHLDARDLLSLERVSRECR